MTTAIITISVIIAAIVFLYFYRTWGSSTSETSSRAPVDKSIPDMPVDFGPKCLWYAVKTEDAQKLAAILKMEPLEPCNWSVGIERAYEDSVFITPAVDGWTFAIGWGLFAVGDTPDGITEVKESLRQLSHEFGEAQYFCNHRGTGYYFWAKAVNGNVTRAYGFDGSENLIVEGEPTGIEKKYNLPNTFSEEAKQENYLDSVDIPFEDTIMEVAGSWSVDPSKLESRNDLKEGLGWLHVPS